MTTPSEKLAEVKRRFARAVLRSAGALSDPHERAALLTHSLPLILGPRAERSAAHKRDIDDAIASSCTPDARAQAVASIARAHAQSATYSMDQPNGPLIEHLPTGTKRRGRFVNRVFVPAESDDGT